VQDLDEVMAHSPADVLLVSLDLKGLEIFSFIDRQKLQSPTVKIVVITVSPDLFQAKELLTAGVNAILTRDTD
jgi:DNA-binding NarL/FixJ family response regulator